MIGSEIVTAFETMVEDSVDLDFAYQLMNNAKVKVEGTRDWCFLQMMDSSQSSGSGAKTLPTLYSRTPKGILYVNTQPFYQVPFNQKHLFEGSSYRWYLDMVNNQFYLLGNTPSGTINHPYIKRTPAITSGTSPVFPEDYHLLLAFEMAEIFYAKDQGDRSRSWDDKWSRQHRLLKDLMIDWDVQLQAASFENALPRDSNPEADLSTM
jgi:hypothetical protein